MMPVIPPRSNRKAPADYDRHLYRERHLVECFINKIKHYRRIFSRFEKLDTRYWAFCISPPLSSGCGEMSTEPRNRAGKPDSPQAVIFLASITDAMIGF